MFTLWYFVAGDLYMKSVEDDFVLEPYISIKLEIEYSLEAISSEALGYLLSYVMTAQGRHSSPSSLQKLTWW